MKRLSALIVILTLFALLFSACGYAEDSGLQSVDLTAESDNAEKGFTVYFLDVGQGDSALVVCDGKTMLIDGGNPSDSDFIYTFLKDHGFTYLDYIVASHMHDDHVGGLSGALNYATVGTALSPVTEFDTRAFNSFIKYLGEQGVEITVPAHGDAFSLGGAEVEIFGPINESSNPNNASIVIKIIYGQTSFLFTGDTERSSEQDILDAGYDISATVLKVGHHGSDTSTTYPFLREIMPQYAVISCGKDNQYGHPHENTLSRLRDADVTLYRTDMQGTIVCTSDGNSVAFSTERNRDIETNPTKPVAETVEKYYIGNANTRKFHRPSCSGLPSEQNRVILDTAEAAIAEGYEPCGRCNP